MTRVALLTEIPAPFRVPLFNELAARDGIELRVLFLSLRDPKRPYPVLHDEFAFEWEALPGRDLLHGSRWVVGNAGVARALRKSRPDVIVLGGWNQPAFWRAALLARRARVPYLVWVESTERDARSGFAGFEAAKRALLRGAAGALVPGRASAEYVARLGVPRERVRIAPNAVDERPFRLRVDELRRDREALRAELGVTAPLVLQVARLDPEKGVDMLVRATEGLGVELALAGTGAEADELRRIASAGTRFLGFLPAEELVRWYAAADVFVLASRSEQWGMVVNEAAAAALPIETTEAVGAAYDLVEEGVSGFRVPPGAGRALRSAIERLVVADGLRARAGARSRELAATHTPEAWADAVEALAREVVS